MREDLLGDPALAEVVSRLTARYSTALESGRLTPYNLATRVVAASGRGGGDAGAGPLGAAEVPIVDVLAALLLIPTARHELDLLEVALIEAVLDGGVTWEQLGAAYGGRNRQTMRELYRRRGGTRPWAPGSSPALAPSSVYDNTGAVSQEIAEVAGTWHVDLRRGCRPEQQVLQEALPVILRLEALGLRSARHPWPEWLAEDRTLPRRVRAAVRAFDQIRDSGSTVVVRAASKDSP